MAIANNSEINRLFSAAFGGNWAFEGMKDASHEDLATVQSLARDHAEQALLQLEELGRGLGSASGIEWSEGRLGALITTMAEWGSVCLHLESAAMDLRDPDYGARLLAGLQRD